MSERLPYCKSVLTLAPSLFKQGSSAMISWYFVCKLSYSETCLRRPLKGREKVVAVARWSSYPGSVGHVTLSTCDSSL